MTTIGYALITAYHCVGYALIAAYHCVAQIHHYTIFNIATPSRLG